MTTRGRCFQQFLRLERWKCPRRDVIALLRWDATGRWWRQAIAGG